jgi:hypothetical protein
MQSGRLRSLRKRLACLDADTPPPPVLPPLGGGQVGGLNDYITRNAIVAISSGVWYDLSDYVAFCCYGSTYDG